MTCCSGRRGPRDSRKTRPGHQSRSGASYATGPAPQSPDERRHDRDPAIGSSKADKYRIEETQDKLQCTQALFSDTLRSLENTGDACQPGYMARGRRNTKRDAAATRAADAQEVGRVDRAEAEARAAKERQLLRRWGTPRGALDRLSAVSKELERLHREEAKLLDERDDLVSLLRSTGQSWNALSSRARLSRQALTKRTAKARSPRGIESSQG